MDSSIRSSAVVAIFRDRSSAEAARAELVRSGFDSSQVDLGPTDELMTNVGRGNAGLSGAHHDSSGGGLSGFFSRLFGMDTDDEDRKYYTDAARRGDSAIVVHADPDSTDRAADILNSCGAVDIQDQSSDQAGYDSRGAYDASGPIAGGDAGALRDGERASIPVVREDVQVGKRAVQRGGVRVHSSVHERPVEEDVNLREERLRVDRRPADRPATEADFAAADRGAIEITETAEEPVIQKSARVVEEVVLSKDVRDRTEKVRDTVQHSKVDVEDIRGGREWPEDDRRHERMDTNFDSDFREDFRTRYGSRGDARYEDYEPAYQYGHQMANDARYRGRKFEDIEDTLRTDYLRNNPNSSWDRAKGAVRYGWEKVTGKR